MSNYFLNMNSFDIHHITLLDNLEIVQLNMNYDELCPPPP